LEPCACDAAFNSHTNRDRLPTDDTLIAAVPRQALAYVNYRSAVDLAPARERDAIGRFLDHTSR
jgi:hypothetical protein